MGEKTIIRLVQADRYCGSYSTKAGLQFQVRIQDGDLFVQCQQQPPLQLFPTSKLEFFAGAVNTNICFEQDDTGNITAMTLNQAGITSLRPQADQTIRAEK